MTVEQIEEMLTEQESRWWSIKIQSFPSIAHFLRYAGRYTRRPPIAQRRITHVSDHSVKFWVKDKKLQLRVLVEISLEEFVGRWSKHIPERYQHAVRNFGLFAPRALRQTSAAIFAVLRQKQRPRPKPRAWPDSLKRDFGHDPLLDKAGNRMTWRRRLPPKATQ
jgi:hypothetical protein